ncbi:hypothetical protein K432DRAFT_407853 [Lepidopterella palustris CBS 459.81]|uniref:Uncharacterized protein n=1 Tax=Lepidopterella palustris CBS 459.81 TaxID=1314670 RepID=A0A8E2E3Z3_9PEZI|nr:hypothetical protein K432DRAFT_407853 [Lepidopterella palustris CBS 459.81]
MCVLALATPQPSTAQPTRRNVWILNLQYNPPSTPFLTAVSDPNWNGSSTCGGCVSDSGPRGHCITAMVIGWCPGCGANHLDQLTNITGAT